MDHLPYPANSAHEPLRVPLLLAPDDIVDSSLALDKRPFPQCCSFRSDPGPLHRLLLADTTAHLQRCLYFGLLSRILSCRISVRHWDNNGFINTSHLPDLLQQQLDSIQGNANQHERTVKAVEQQLKSFTRTFDHQEQVTHVENAQLIVLSIRVLSDSLWRALRHRPEYAAPEYMRYHENYIKHLSSPGTDCHVLRKRMSKENGWCNATVVRILKHFSSSTAYYLSSICRRADVLAASHNDCSELECKLYVQDETSYRQQHHTDCRQTRCKMITIPLEKVVAVIQNGGIPLVRLNGEKLEVQKAEYNLDYTAISHVWSGGLGNPRENALWMCQLRNITKLPSQCHQVIKPPLLPSNHILEYWRLLWDSIYTPGKLAPKRALWFWIDTLCVPRSEDPALDQQAQQLIWSRRGDAINRMAQTYAAASSTIVLDPELLRFPFRTSESKEGDVFEAFARIYSSTWMTRCWTYQEAAMSFPLLAQFADGPFSIHHYRERVVRRYQYLIQQSASMRAVEITDMIDEISTWVSALPRTRQDTVMDDVSQSSPEVFVRIWNSLGARTTSRKQDRFQILSLLVDLKPTDVMSVHSKARLKAILKAQKRLPLALLFQHPLTEHERREVQIEEEEEERAARDRGQQHDAYTDDKPYPLPSRIGNRPLLSHLGWMQRGPDPGHYVFFDTELIDAGYKRPSLFALKTGYLMPETTYTLFHRANKYSFNIHIPSFQYRQGEDLDVQLYILVSLDPSLEDSNTIPTEFVAVCLFLEHVSQSSDSDHGEGDSSIWKFQYLCHASCDSFTASLQSSSLLDLEIIHSDLLPNNEYRIHADLSQVPHLRNHRLKGFAPSSKTAERFLSLFIVVFLLYYTIFAIVAGVIMLWHPARDFPTGSYSLVPILFFVRMSFIYWNNYDTYWKAAQSIIFNEWVNSLYQKEETPEEILERNNYTGFSIHMGPWHFSFFLLFNLIFLGVGFGGHDDPNLRFMIPVGLAGVGEILLRWVLELTHDYPYISVISRTPSLIYGEPEHGALYAEFWSESRFTRWIRGLSFS